MDIKTFIACGLLYIIFGLSFGFSYRELSVKYLIAVTAFVIIIFPIFSYIKGFYIGFKTNITNTNEVVK